MMRERPSRDQVLMKMAMAQAERGTCERAQVGVVIARDGRVLATGYNGAPSGLSHCDHTVPLKAGYVPGLREGPGIGATSDPGCKISVHAEANAIAYAARYGMALDNSVMYTTYTPCLACAQLIINSGIVSVVALRAYRDQAGADLVEAAGVSMIHMPEVI